MEVTNTMRRKAVFASVVGSLLEWYDFFLYAVIAAIIFNKQYFPTNDPFVSNMLAWGSVAVAHFSRPIGGFIFGHFGDRVGRKSMLMITLLIMGFSTVLIGCLPTYNQIGIWSPILLITLRTFQGIGLGGEWGGAVLLTYEYATPKTRCFYGSLTQLGLSLCMFLASGIVGLLTIMMDDASFQSWGWRIPFWISVVMLAVGWYVRVSVMETPDFQKVQEKRQTGQQQHKIPLVELMTKHGKQAWAGFLARGIGGVGFNIMATYIIVYLTQIMLVPRDSALLAVNVGTVFLTLMIPISGWLADKYGGMKVFIIGCFIEGICGFPIFYLITHSQGSVFMACVGLAIYLGLIHGIVSGLSPSFYSSMFPAHVRYTGISFTFMFANVFFAGATPMIALTLVRMNDNQPWLLCSYILFIGMISTVAGLWIKKDKERREAEEASNVSIEHQTT